MRWSRILAAVLAAGVIAAACSGEGQPTGADDPAVDASVPTTLATSTTQPPNRPPELRVVPIGRAEIGQRLTEPILGFDPDGDDVVVSVEGGPLGFSPTLNTRGRVTGFAWEPVEPGEWTVAVTAVDPDGATTVVDVTLVARNPRSLDLVLAMGDSVAAGFGRDRSDFLGSDECFRSEESAYGLQTHAELVEVGSLESEADALLVACTGTTTASMLDTPVIGTGPDGDVNDLPARSQLQWAVDLNPTIVTLTVGAADFGLFDPADFEVVVAADDEDLAARRRDAEEALAELVDRLVTETDAHIAITTYFDPTAADPVGIDGCEGQCFAASYGERILALNAAIETVAGEQSEGRVSLIRLDGANDVWEAGNAVGPDGLREGLGPLQGVIDRFTGGGGATCAADGAPEEDFISGLDCLHPNADGHVEISRLVVDALLSI